MVVLRENDCNHTLLNATPATDYMMARINVLTEEIAARSFTRLIAIVSSDSALLQHCAKTIVNAKLLQHRLNFFVIFFRLKISVTCASNSSKYVSLLL